MLRIALVSLLAVLAGCGNLQNISATDIRNPEHLRAEKTFPLSIQQISQALYDHRMQCRDAGQVLQSPSNPKEGIITIEMPGRSKASVALLVDLSQDGSVTHARGYTYYSTWKDQVGNIFKAIEAPEKCD